MPRRSPSDSPETDPSDDTPPGEPVRLQKILAAAGVGSRRHCEEYIATGRVSVDGITVFELGTKVDPDHQVIKLDGQVIRAERKVWYALNKPVGYISTTNDPQGRPQVIDLLGRTRERLFTVGRLDDSSQGLILITNDGELAHRLAHPRFGVEKIYRVQVAGIPDAAAMSQLRNGVEFQEGLFKVQSVRRLRQLGQSTVLEVVLNEGQNREIRRLLAKIGHKVIKLERLAFGPIRLGKLPLGGFRPLTTREMSALRLAAGGTAPRPKSTKPKRTYSGPAGNRGPKSATGERRGSAAPGKRPASAVGRNKSRPARGRPGK